MDWTTAREALFSEFAWTIREGVLRLALMVTGGFQARQRMAVAVAEANCDFIGLDQRATLDLFMTKQYCFQLC